MPYEMQCNMCNVAIQVDESKAGSIIHCPSCGQLILAQPHASDDIAPAPPMDSEQAAVHMAGNRQDESDAGNDEVVGAAEDESAAQANGPASDPGYQVTSDQPAADDRGESPPDDDSESDYEPVWQPEEPLAASSVVTPGQAAPVAADLAVVPKQRGSFRFVTLAGAYASGILLGLILGKYLFHRSTLTGLELIRDDGAYKRSLSQWVAPTVPVPPGQRAKLGQTIELGQLSVTALTVELQAIELNRNGGVESGGQASSGGGECLVLKLRLKNTSANREFAPLDPVFLRPHPKKKRPNYSFIELSQGGQIAMYELSPLSDWTIRGQPFRTIKPGEELEAIVAASSGSAELAQGPMTWRVQLRAGGYESRSYTTVVGFDFTPDQIRG